MRIVRKAIRRVSKDKSRAAMERHIKTMAKKGWLVSHDYEGERYGRWEVITYFCK